MRTIKEFTRQTLKLYGRYVIKIFDSYHIFWVRLLNKLCALPKLCIIFFLVNFRIPSSGSSGSWLSCATSLESPPSVTVWLSVQIYVVLPYALDGVVILQKHQLKIRHLKDRYLVPDFNNGETPFLFPFCVNKTKISFWLFSSLFQYSRIYCGILKSIDNYV